MTDEQHQGASTNADLLLAMVSGLPSEYLRRATLVAERREYREERLRILQARDSEAAEARLAEMEARAATPERAA